MIESEAETTVGVEVGHRNSWRYLLVVLFLSGMILAWVVQRAARYDLDERGVADRFDTSIPTPDLDPAEVVSLQMESLRAADENPERLIECYSLAAPSNRSVTGPFDNFAAIVQSPPYDQLGASAAYQVGTPVEDQQTAAVLVTVLTEADQSLAFRFVLARQTEAPYAGCWMTEGVFPLTAADLASMNAAVEARQPMAAESAGQTPTAAAVGDSF